MSPSVSFTCHIFVISVYQLTDVNICFKSRCYLMYEYNIKINFFILHYFQQFFFWFAAIFLHIIITLHYSNMDINFIFSTLSMFVFLLNNVWSFYCQFTHAYCYIITVIVMQLTRDSYTSFVLHMTYRLNWHISNTISRLYLVFMIMIDMIMIWWFFLLSAIFERPNASQGNCGWP